MHVLRTPDARFDALEGYPFAPRYVDVDAGDGSPSLRMHYVDEGRGPTVLLLHGEPSWSYLYRTMIPPLVAAGLRCVAPDLVGFGRSDKPSDRYDYTYARHVAWTKALVAKLALTDVTMFCQDWGGLVGLRLVADEPERYARVLASNTALPTGDQKPPEAFFAWQQFSQSVPELPVSGILRGGTVRPLSPGALAAYDAPFPDETYKAGARQFPMLVPARPDDPASDDCRHAWASLERYTRPFLTLFGDSDPVTRGAEKPFQRRIPGAAGQPHALVANAGHFIQEDAGAELAEHLARFALAR